MNASNHFLIVLQENHFNFIISLSNGFLNEEIHCKSNIEIIEDLKITNQEICKCHTHPINQMEDVDICGINFCELDSYQIESAVNIGNQMIPIKFDLNSKNSNIILNVIEKIDLNSISQSQLTGKVKKKKKSNLK